MAKVLVTGGAGFIGYHLSNFLLKKKYNITICDNLFRGRMDDDLKILLENKNVHYIECDLTDANSTSKLDKKYDYVYHLAAINGTRYFYEMPDKVLRVNLLAAINILDWFIQTKSGKILFSSSSENYAGTYAIAKMKIPTPEDVPLCIEDVYNERKSYAASKIAGELLFINYARKYKFDMGIVRYHNVYGPRMGHEHVIPEFISRTLKKENPFNIYGGDETRAFCFIEDAVTATQLAMESKNTNMQILNIGTMQELKINELAKKVINLAGYNPKIKINEAPKGSVRRRCPDIAKIKKLTGYSPVVGIDEGLRKTFAWYSRNLV